MILSILIWSGKSFSQDLRDSTIVANSTIDNLHRKIDDCDSLKNRYNQQRKIISDYSIVTLRLLKENDSLQSAFKKESLKLNLVDEKLTKTKRKKGVSVLKCVLIGIGAFGAGALIF